MRFGLIHIVSTNVCVWTWSTVIETAEHYQILSMGPSSEDTDESLQNLQGRYTVNVHILINPAILLKQKLLCENVVTLQIVYQEGGWHL